MPALPAFSTSVTLNSASFRVWASERASLTGFSSGLAA
jgi:hypothetical protein